MHPSRAVAPEVQQWIDEAGYRILDCGERTKRGDLRMHSMRGSKPATPRHYWTNLDKWTVLGAPYEINENAALVIRRREYTKVTETVDAMLKGLLDAEEAYMKAIEDEDYIAAGKYLYAYRVVLEELCVAIGKSQLRVQDASLATANLPARPAS